jgi:hypothetical protein
VGHQLPQWPLHQAANRQHAALLDRNQDMQKLIAGMLTLALLGGSAALAQDAGGARNLHPRHRYTPLPPHQQPREASAPDNAIGPTDREKALDSKINNICRGC